MAKKGGCLACGCLVPVILVAVMVMSVLGVYLWMPVGTTFKIDQQELFVIDGEAVSLRSLGLEKKSIHQLLNNKINKLGTIGDKKLFANLSLNELGLGNNSLRDISRKTIKELGNFYDFPLSSLFSNISGSSRQDGGYALAGGGDPSETDFNVDIGELLTGNMGTISFRTLHLGNERLLDFRLNTLMGLTRGETPLVAPLLQKKIGALSEGEFKDLNFITLLSADALAEFNLTHADFGNTFVVKNLKFNDTSKNILNMTLLEFITNIGDLKVDLGDLLLDDEFDIDSVLGPEFVDFNSDTLYDNKQFTEIQNTNFRNGTIDYAAVLAGKYVAPSGDREQLHYLDTELTAIFNVLIYDGRQANQELYDLDARILKVLIGPYDAEAGTFMVTTILRIPSANMGGAEAFGEMPPFLYFKVENIMTVHVLPIAPYSLITPATHSAQILNLKPGFSNFILSSDTGGGGTLGDNMGMYTGALFAGFIVNMGYVGLLPDQYGAGLDETSGREISVITRDEDDIAAEEAALQLAQAA